MVSLAMLLVFIYGHALLGKFFSFFRDSVTVEFSSPLESLGVKVRLSKIENRNLKSEICDQTLYPLSLQNWCFFVFVFFRARIRHNRIKRSVYKQASIPPQLAQNRNVILLTDFYSFSCNPAVPISSSPVQALSAKVGDTIELDCSVASQSNTEISWFKYGAPLQDITYRRTDGQSKSGKLLLDDLLLADSGNYTCSVNNTLGKINKTFALRVYG